MNPEPLVIEFEVAVTPAHAFEAWTDRCGAWWPASHTISGDPAAITFEPRTGGRIVEHTRDGVEHDWGTVLDWQPPTRLRYMWHLFFDASEGTEVELTFSPHERGTAVRLRQTGWDRLGAAGAPRRTKTEAVWTDLTAGFIRACATTRLGPKA